ncbi:MAG TPA: ester cyclase [Gaiellaceae bacterium]|jgi:steroid delta-isomerase-like uncharacterized protein
MAADNKMISRRVVEEGFAQGKVELFDDLVAEDVVNHDETLPPEIPPGREGVKALAQGYKMAFPDLVLTVEDQIAEGDKVATRWTARGTHQGELMGIPPTGKEARVTGTTIDRIEDGQIVETWTNWDQVSLLQQLGVIPEMARTS